MVSMKLVVLIVLVACLTFVEVDGQATDAVQSTVGGGGSGGQGGKGNSGGGKGGVTGGVEKSVG